MAEKSNIAWTESSWNPVRGCERVSEGCRNCYAEVLAARHSYPGGWGEGLAKVVKRPDGTEEARWTGVVRPVEKMLDAPLRWKKPRRIFVNSMSDLFHKDVPDDFIDKIFAVMALAPRHTFQVLTKRPERMLEYMTIRSKSVKYWEAGARSLGYTMMFEGADGQEYGLCKFPIPGVWLGVSVEDQASADERIPLLLQTPAAVRWLSCEPLLGPVSLRWLAAWDGKALKPRGTQPTTTNHLDGLRRLRWVVIGGESGSGYRRMDMEHARILIAQCKAAGVATFVKQDNGPRPGMQGRFTAEEWALKEYPA